METSRAISTQMLAPAAITSNGFVVRAATAAIA
jgi:hypothetical protein